MTNLNESYLAGHGFDITTTRLKTDGRSAALPTVLPGPMNMRAFLYICVRAQMCARLNVRMGMQATDVRANKGWRDGWI